MEQLNHTHNHVKKDCNHEHLSYCSVCDCVYCDNCGKEWKNQLTGGWRFNEIPNYPAYKNFVGDCIF